MAATRRERTAECGDGRTPSVHTEATPLIHVMCSFLSLGSHACAHLHPTKTAIKKQMCSHSRAHTQRGAHGEIGNALGRRRTRGPQHRHACIAGRRPLASGPRWLSAVEKCMRLSTTTRSRTEKLAWYRWQSVRCWALSPLLSRGETPRGQDVRGPCGRQHTVVGVQRRHRTGQACVCVREREYVCAAV